MNTDYYREFIELANTLNFTNASKKLNMTQPALSKHISALEHEYGTKFFNRLNNKVSLTGEGRILYEAATVIVSQEDKTKERLRQIAKSRPITVGGHFGDGDIDTLMTMVSMVARERLEAPIVFSREVSSDPFQQLKQGKLDVFVSYICKQDADAAGVESKELLSIPLVAFVGAQQPFDENRSYSIENFHNHAFIRFRSIITDYSWMQIDHMFENHGIVPKIRSINAINDIEFFSTPLENDVLLWKKSQKQLGLLLETGRRKCITLSDSDAMLEARVCYLKENEEKLDRFFYALEVARKMYMNRKGHFK